MTSLDTIASLLSMAERTTNEHEAAAFLAKAQTLATLAAVDLEVARRRTHRGEARQRPVTRTVTIGDPGKRANRHLVLLFVSVAHANDVVVDAARNSTYVLAYGMPSDLDAVTALWSSLAHQMVRAANAYLAVGTWRGETYAAMSTRAVGGMRLRVPVAKPHTATTARAAFYQGFIARIGRRLADAREAALRATDDVPADAGVNVPGPAGRRGPDGPEGRDGPGGPDDRDGPDGPLPAARPTTGELVLAAKADEVRAYHREESTARGSWRGYRGGGLGDLGTATSSGRRAASRARLGRSPEIGGSPPSLPGPREP